METLKIFKVPLCVGPVVCEDFENFSKFPCVWAGDFEIFSKFQSFPVCGCVGCKDFETFKVP